MQLGTTSGERTETAIEAASPAMPAIRVAVLREERLQEGGAELRDRLDAALAHAAEGAAEGLQEGLGDFLRRLRLEDAHRELPDLRVAVGEQWQQLRVEGRVGPRQQRRQRGDGGFLDAGRLVVAALQERGDVGVAGVPGEDADRAVPELLVVVLEGPRGQGRRPRRGRREALDDREGLAPDRRGGGRQRRRDARQEPLGGVAPRVVERGMDDGRIPVAEVGEDLFGEGGPRQRLERLHRRAANGLGAAGKLREERLRRRVVRKPPKPGEALLAQDRVGVRRRPGDVLGLELLERVDPAQQIVPFGVTAPAARLELRQKRAGFRRDGPSSCPHGYVLNSVTSPRRRRSDSRAGRSRLPPEKPP